MFVCAVGGGGGGGGDSPIRDYDYLWSVTS